VVGDWNYPTAIRFGAGRRRELAEACRALGLARPLLVTDRGLADGELVAEVRALLPAALPHGLFAEVTGNPTQAQVAAGLACLRGGGHDGVVGLGGGSALDVAKAIALLAGQRRPLFDFVDDGENWRRADPAGILPVIALPTAAGTGSEVGRSAVITDAGKTKRVIFHPRMLPALVICDPELTYGLPPELTAATGMDAFSHCLEAYCCAGFHPMADAIALRGMALAAEALPRAVRDGRDSEARATMLAVSTMGATAFQKGLGAMHAMSHPCSARFGTHHGLTNAVLMPYVLSYNRPVIAQKLAVLARHLGLSRADDAGVLDRLLRLRQEISIPHRLTALGVPADAAELLAPLAAADPLSALNPRPATVADYGELYRRALDGDLS